MTTPRFEFIQRWRDLGHMMTQGPDALQQFINLMEERDRDLEDWLHQYGGGTGGGSGGGDATDFTNTNWKVFGNAAVSSPSAARTTASDTAANSGVIVWSLTLPRDGFHMTFTMTPKGIRFTQADVLFYDGGSTTFWADGSPANDGWAGLPGLAVIFDTYNSQVGLDDMASSASLDSVGATTGGTHTYTISITAGMMTIIKDSTTITSTFDVSTLPSTIMVGFYGWANLNNVSLPQQDTFANLSNTSF